MAAPLKLYDYWRSTAGYRVRLALEIKGVPYERHPLNLMPGASEQRSDRYGEVNPERRLPTLVLPNGEALGQSGAILQWLEAMYPEPRLWPDDALQAARIRRVCDVIACDIHPIGNVGVLEALTERYGCDFDAALAWKDHWIRRGFDALEPQVKSLRGAGPHAAGAAITAADLYIVPQVYNARRGTVDLSRYPTLAAVDEACVTLEAFQRARPDVQSDAV